MGNRLFPIVALFLLSACSTLPPAIKNPPAVDISYRQASAGIAQYQGASARWGGVVIDVLNEQNYSLLQVMAYPLNGNGRPDLDKAHEGRFYVKSPEFLDPAIYAKDREVTAAGTLNGDKELTVGKKTLRLPLIEAHTIHLWPEYERPPYYYYNGYYPYYYGYPYFWGGGYFLRYPPY